MNVASTFETLSPILNFKKGKVNFFFAHLKTYSFPICFVIVIESLIIAILNHISTNTSLKTRRRMRIKRRRD